MIVRVKQTSHVKEQNSRNLEMSIYYLQAYAFYLHKLYDRFFELKCTYEIANAENRVIFRNTTDFLPQEKVTLFVFSIPFSVLNLYDIQFRTLFGLFDYLDSSVTYELFHKLFKVKGFYPISTRVNTW